MSKKSVLMEKIQRFGAAMFTPVLLFSFSGIMVSLAIVCKNQDIMGALANSDGMWYKFWHVIEEGSWTVFRQLPFLFVIGLPIGLAKKNNARAALESLVIYLTFNYFVSAILSLWGPSFGVDFAQEVGGESGLTMIANIKTLDTGMIGAILIAGIVVYLHDRFFDTELPEWLGIFKGSSLVVIVGFFVMLPVAFLMCLIWPKVQGGISSLQGFLRDAGVFGVGIYTFLERILIPTGLHHFIYTPFIYGPAVVENGIAMYFPQHLQGFASSAQSLKVMFPEGGFALHGLSKVFGCTGIALAIYSTARSEKKKAVAGLLIPATLTAAFAGITEPLEFTFLFVAPILFAVHSVLAAILAATSYAFGVVGDFGGGLIDWVAKNWIPLFKYHSGTYITQIVVGLIFTGIWFLVFRYLILKFDFKTPGREGDAERTKLYRKSDYKAMKEAASTKEAFKEDPRDVKARKFLELLGGKENIAEVTNCATRLRVTVKDETLVAIADEFKEVGAHGLVKKGNAIQVIVGLSVPQIRERFEKLL